MQPRYCPRSFRFPLFVTSVALASLGLPGIAQSGDDPQFLTFNAFELTRSSDGVTCFAKPVKPTKKHGAQLRATCKAKPKGAKAWEEVEIVDFSATKAENGRAWIVEAQLDDREEVEDYTAGRYSFNAPRKAEPLPVCPPVHERKRAMGAAQGSQNPLCASSR